MKNEIEVVLLNKIEKYIFFPWILRRTIVRPQIPAHGCPWEVLQDPEDLFVGQIFRFYWDIAEKKTPEPPRSHLSNETTPSEKYSVNKKLSSIDFSIAIDRKGRNYSGWSGENNSHFFWLLIDPHFHYFLIDFQSMKPSMGLSDLSHWWFCSLKYFNEFLIDFNRQWTMFRY